MNRAGCHIGRKLSLDARIDLLQPLGALLFVADLVSGLELGFGQRSDSRHQSLVLGCRLPVPLGLAGLFDQTVDGLNGGAHLVVAEDDCTEHDVFRQLVRLGLDHEHCALGAGHHEVQLGRLKLRCSGIEDVLAIRVADTGGANRPVEGNARNGQRGRGADHGRNVGVDLGVERQHVDHDLHLVVEPLWKERAQRPVDEAGGQGLFLRGSALSLEEASGDLSRSVGLFNVIHRQGEEVLAGLRRLCSHHSGEHDGVIDTDDHRPSGLTSDFPGLEGDGVLPELE